MLMPTSSVGMGMYIDTYAHTLILLKLNCGNYWTSLVAQTVKNMPAMQETRVQSLGQEDPLEKGMATHSSILSRRITWTEEPSSPWSHKELHTTEQLTLSLFLS